MSWQGTPPEAVERHPLLTRVARAISILGHPLLLTPVAGLAAWTSGGGGGEQVLGIAVAGLLLVVIVMGYSYRRVRNGDWAHVDASGRGERRSLNRFLLVAFVAATIAGQALQWPHQLLLGLLLSAAMVAAAMLAARWCKPSLHLAFALLSAGFLWAVSTAAFVAGVLAVMAIAWSRLYLRRHVAVDLWCGAMIGAAAGAAFWSGAW